MWFLFAAASALCFGLRGILYQWTSQRPLNRNLLLLGVYASGTLIALVAAAVTGQAWTKPVWIGTLLGLFSFISNAAMYKGYSVGKASLVAMFTGLPPVVVVLFAYVLWGEKLNTAQLAVFVVIVAGILMIRYSNDISLKNLQGAHWGAITMLFFGLTDLSSKQATLIGAATLPTLALMYGTGSLLFAAAWLLERKQEAFARAAIRAGCEEAAAGTEAGPAEAADSMVREAAPANAAGRGPAPALARGWSPGRTLVWGMFVGITNVCGMILAMPAFAAGVTGLVSVVIAMNVVLVLFYARFGLKEKFSRLESGGLLLALIGIIVLRLAA
ncbi:DMT family transporter [Paenibacillus ehimensis]|uniref:DMT family transporter n=1 Tax=Paenibacillus ehimensis TaxID=79264 RepID=UPI002DBD4844|nr:DMT family transporter [Paenibacillus ehimensis]MEC0212017.1 DMT family transporter [Paenibacillus ehimensis]